jgi:hypothetical protein
MTTPAAKWKAAERARHKEAGRVPVTVYVYPEAREKLHRYVKRLNERTNGAEPDNVEVTGKPPCGAAGAR